MISKRLTPLEQRIVDRLSDGQFHPSGELLNECLPEGTAYSSLSVYISYIRKKLMPGYLILCVNTKMKRGYRLVQSVSKDE